MDKEPRGDDLHGADRWRETLQVSGSRTQVRDHQVNVKQTVGTRRKAKATSWLLPAAGL